MNTAGDWQFRDIRFESFETFRVPAIAASGAGHGSTTELPGRRPMLASPEFPTQGRGRTMTTFNRIFTTERLLQIIVILAATIAMKLMA